MENQLLKSITAILGEGAVLTAPEDRAPYEKDWRGLVQNPALAVVLPKTTAQTSEIVKLCAAHGIKIVPQGGNTGLVAGGVPVAGVPQIILALNRMANVRDVDTTGDTITVEAGMTLQAVQEAAAQAGRFFPVSLGAEGTARIGGNISTNAGGLQVLAYGNMRPQVLGLEVVLADGRIWNGLRALRKDNTGYDLKQVFIGAEGTLGIVTAACLKLYPKIAARASAIAGLEAVEDVLKLFLAARARAGTGLTLSEYMARPAFGLGVKHCPAGRLPFEAPCYLLLEISSLDAANDPTALLENILAAALEQGIARDAVIAQSERERLDFVHMREAISEGELREGGAVKHDISVPLSKLPAMVAAVEKLVAEKYPDCRPNVYGHVGDGNLHINIRPPEGQTMADLGARKAAITEDVETLAAAMDGSISAEHGIGQLRLSGMAAHKSVVERDMMMALKRAFDPAGLFNPGKLLP